MINTMLASKLRPLYSSEPTARGLSACAFRFLSRPALTDGVSNTFKVNRPNLRKNYSSMDFFEEVISDDRPEQAQGQTSCFRRKRSVVPVDQVLANINLELKPRRRPRKTKPLVDPKPPTDLKLPKRKLNEDVTLSWDIKPHLDVPTELDDIKATLLKLRRLREIIEHGKSIGWFTALRFAATPGLNAEQSVIDKLHPPPRRWYFAWKYKVYNPRHGFGPNGEGHDHGKKIILPAMNWRDNVAPVPSDPDSRSKFAGLAEAVDVVYGHSGATLENAMWLRAHDLRIFHLIVAVKKILYLERYRRLDQAPAMPGLNREEAADVQTIRRVVAQTNANVNRELMKYLQWVYKDPREVYKDPQEEDETVDLGDLLKWVNEVNECLTVLKDHSTRLENKCMKDYHFGHQSTNHAKESTKGQKTRKTAKEKSKD
ncbi:uncharacterized protein BDV14DRAFT_63973 [Aspergillus stella-maris]|uniref:uncharacterized protein n=1 Tax=Aspergillus stella-maris TaxID=1810926 RepID=UPI003CCD52BC